MRRLLLPLTILILSASVQAQVSRQWVRETDVDPTVCIERTIHVNRLTGASFVRVAGGCTPVGSDVTTSSANTFTNKTITDPSNNVTADQFRNPASLPGTSTEGDVSGRTDGTLHYAYDTNAWAQIWAANINTSLAEINSSCVDAGANDTYACSLNPAIASYAVGSRLRFFPNTANTGAASINFNAIGALTLVKVAGGITTALADNDIRAGQWVECVVAAGLNCQVVSGLGNAGSGGVALGDSPTWTGAHTFSKNGELSLPTISVTGTPITGGTATTTKPLVNIETAGATSTAWSTSGTMFGVNAPSGFTGDLIRAQVNGITRLTMTGGGVLTTTGTIASGAFMVAPSGFQITSSTYWNAPANGSARFSNAAATGFQTFALGSVAPSAIGTAPANGQVVSIIQGAELLTIAAAATTTTTMQIPAGAVVMAVSVRVTTVIPTATTFTVKVGATTVSTAAVSTAASTTDVGTAAGSFYNGTAQGVTITPDVTPGDATGVVRVTVMYYLVTPPTS